MCSVVLACLTLARPADAHDANLARWDVSARDDELVVTLITAGAGLADDRRTAGAADDAAHLREALRVWVGGARVRPTRVDVVQGHEATATLGFAYAPPLDEVRIDLGGTSVRPNQHHLVFVWLSGERERFMLGPDAPAQLTWARSALPLSSRTAETADHTPAVARGSHTSHTARAPRPRLGDGWVTLVLVVASFLLAVAAAPTRPQPTKVRR